MVLCNIEILKENTDPTSFVRISSKCSSCSGGVLEEQGSPNLPKSGPKEANSQSKHSASQGIDVNVLVLNKSLTKTS